MASLFLLSVDFVPARQQCLHGKLERLERFASLALLHLRLLRHAHGRRAAQLVEAVVAALRHGHAYRPHTNTASMARPSYCT